MQLEAIKIDGQFVIPQLSNMELNTDKIIVDINDNLIKNLKKGKKSKAYQSMEELDEKLGGDELIKVLLKNTPIDYEYNANKSDKEILLEELKEKYGL